MTSIASDQEVDVGIVYTHGVWQVRPGRAADFVAAWRELAEWSVANVPGAMWAKLLCDTEDDLRFVSMGPWANADAVSTWRSLPGWSERIGRIRELLDGFTPSTLEPVVEIGQM